MWIIVTIGILLIIFLIIRKKGYWLNGINNEKQNQETSIKAEESIITTIDDNTTSPIKKEEETATRNYDEDTHYENNDIVWTTELLHIKSIMFFTPQQAKRSPKTRSNAREQYCKKQESLTPIEQYELAVWFAELIGEADNLHNANMFAEERKYCLNAIKWCAKENVSILYWQDRLNQVNEILGIKPIDIADKSGSKKETDKKYLSASDKYELYKSFTNPLEAEYQYYHSNKNIAEEQKVVQKAIKFARENNLIYYEQKWIERIVNPPKDDMTSIEQRLKEKKRQRHTYDNKPTKKKRRPRIPYTSKNEE